ncbi:ElaB/YqjD/DUF883 family membrane-anchored ribosome-binding protein [Paraburkholderia sp. HC6.4b]|uniref:hypothetical protein n=1 Tax=unclassified Paraburkholderia TaxID=2615204 RepID=UPI00160C137F|nr:MULTISPECIES: hypothetical protein [unclassified Paraburkholderia]MBB5409158.1 ElaB/YqjD/DUF883 family membrane-anchored ribosome-binding protein [Paraburkholderia sp. HC6.4b]MBB5450886.1 ElaB/YqjD/DUF883 family membrane-anchored ribosome-binding protein [Paraburkholderia sp. Kb1A]
MLNNVLKFAATAAQETSGIFDNAPVESVVKPASGFLETCTDWVNENRNAVVGAGAAVAVGVGIYYSYPWLRDKVKDMTGGKTEATSATPEANAAPTAEEIQEGLEEAVRKANEYTTRNPKSAKK